MAFSFPVSLDLTGRRCVVVGGGPVAEHKARALLAAGARVAVVAPEPTEGLRELARREQGTGRTRLELVLRAYGPGDLEDAFLAVAATDDGSVRAAVFGEAERRGVLMNAVDDVAHSHFAFPAVVRRGELVLAVSTGGKAPALAKRVRRALSASFGPEYGVLVDLLAEVRAELMPRSVEFEEWARRWERALEEDLPALVREGRAKDVRQLLRTCLTASSEHRLPAAPGPGHEPCRREERAGGSCGTGPSGSAAWVEGWEVPGAAG